MGNVVQKEKELAAAKGLARVRQVALPAPVAARAIHQLQDLMASAEGDDEEDGATRDAGGQARARANEGARRMTLSCTRFGSPSRPTAAQRLGGRGRRSPTWRSRGDARASGTRAWESGPGALGGPHEPRSRGRRGPHRAVRRRRGTTARLPRTPRRFRRRRRRAPRPRCGANAERRGRRGRESWRWCCWRYFYQRATAHSTGHAAKPVAATSPIARSQ